MITVKAILGLAMLAAGLLAASAASPVAAREISVAAGSDLQSVVDEAREGDVLRLAPGVHHGPVVIGHAITLEGEADTVVDAGGTGSVVRIEAPDVVVRNLTLRGSGDDFKAMDAGVFVDRTGHRALVEGNRSENNLYGIYLWGAEGAIARGNVVIGQRDKPYSRLGSGISLWNAPGSEVVGNDIRYGRDGIFVNTSKRNVFRDNVMRDLRFAVHYMYTNDSELTGNVSVGNDVGFAIMFSHRLKVENNLSDGDRDHGFLFNYANYSDVRSNKVAGGGEKCVFIYNANFNTFLGNWFEGCEIGIHFTAGSESNEMSGNAFIQNRSQVKYVGTRLLDWSSEGRGNFWSDNPAFDLDGDGIADTPYRPNDVVDQVLWRNPLAKILVTSPAVQTIRWAQSQLPALQPGGVVDTAPLMRPPEIEVASRPAVEDRP